MLHVTRGVPVPTACKLRKERMIAIGVELAKAEYDIVLLQEVCQSMCLV